MRGDMIPLAILIVVSVLVVAPIAIYVLAKYSDLDSYRKRFRKANPYLFWRDKTDNDS